MQLPHIEIIIDGVTYDNTFARDVMIDRTNLEVELATHAERYAYYAFLAATARAKEAIKKMEKDQLYARVDFEKRRAAQQVPGFKYTEKMCENEVITDPRYTTLSEEYITAKLLADQLEECARAMAQRREMLVQLGGISRQQMAPQRVVEQQAAVVERVIASNRAPAPPPPVTEEDEPPPMRRRRGYTGQ
jgi:hypothetical protein